MMDSDARLITIMTEALRPFERAYMRLTPEEQLSLDGNVPVNISYIRDAFLVMARVRKASRVGTLV